MSSIQIADYHHDYWDELSSLVHKEWKKDHPITNKPLFDWQYKGFGHDKYYSKVIFIDGKIEGFLGNIPGLYQVPGYDQIVSGTAFAVWFISDTYKNSGYGIYPFMETLREFDICLVAGLNDKVKPIYLKTGFNYSPALKRYVLPLCFETYKDIAKYPVSTDELKKWFDSIDLSSEPIKPSTPDSERLFDIWKNHFYDKGLFSLYKNTEFWDWRYLNSKGFKYEFFICEDLQCFAIGHFENIIAPENEVINNKKVFRIIELVCDLYNEDNINKTASSLILPLLSYLKQQDCIAVDFQCSSDLFDPLLLKCQFKKQDESCKPDIASLVPLFQPFRPNVNSINLAWKVCKDSKVINIDLDKTMILKSDGDMDRPNFIS